MPPDCSSPLHEMLVNQTVDWMACSHALNSGGTLVVGTLMYTAIAVVLFNWTESVYPPMVWTALSASIIFSYLPGDLLMRVMSLLTIMVAFALVMLWQAWRR